MNHEWVSWLDLIGVKGQRKRKKYIGGGRWLGFLGKEYKKCTKNGSSRGLKFQVRGFVGEGEKCQGGCLQSQH